MSNTESSSEDKNPQPGDLIEIFRGLYQHWAVYIGDNFIVHFVRADGESRSTNVSGNGIVMKQKLRNLVKNDMWKVNNLLDSQYKPLKANDIVKKANKLVGEEKRYDLISYNCEHFATELRYSKPQSQQIHNMAEVAIMGSAALWGSVAVGFSAFRAGSSLN